MNVSYIVGLRNEMNCLYCIYRSLTLFCIIVIEFRKFYTKFMISIALFIYLAVKPVADPEEVQVVRLKPH